MPKLSIPTYAKAFSTRGGPQMLKVWRGSSLQFVNSPLEPYLYSLKDITDRRIRRKERVRLVSNITKRPNAYWKYTFRNTKDLDSFAETYADTIQPTDNFIDLIAQHYPDFFRQFPTENYKVLVLDIEQWTDGTRFPNHGDPIISIAWSIDDKPIQQMHYDQGPMQDELLLNAFAEVIQAEDPDIIVTFNGCKYDIPMLMARMDKWGIPESLWARDGGRPFPYTKNIGPTELNCIAVGGRLMFDVYHSVLTDLTLGGEKKGLKPVAKLFAGDLCKMHGITKEEYLARILTANTSRTDLLVCTPELADYNKSDVAITRDLFNMYFPNNMGVAEFSGVSLNRVVPLNKTYPFTQELARLYIKKGILAEATNRSRYPWAWSNLGTYINDEGEEEEQKPYIGAINKCYVPRTRHVGVKNSDVGSLYPAIMAGLGAAADNTRVLRTDPLGPFKVEVDGETRTYHLPDKMRDWNWVVEVRGWSEVAGTIKSYMDRRLEVKARAKTEKSLSLFSLAYALKNSITNAYGLAGNPISPFGELGVAVLTTIMGRMIIEEAHRLIGADKTFYIDTDGIYYDQSVPLGQAELNEHFRTWFPEVTKGKPYIAFEDEVMDFIYFKQEKSYVYIQGGKFVKKGGAFKSTKYSNIFNKVINEVGPLLLKEGVEAAQQRAESLVSLKAHRDQDFVMSIRVGKPMSEYKTKTLKNGTVVPSNAIAAQVARLAQAKLGIEPYVGQTIEYVKVEGGYDLPSEAAFKNLDATYYLGVIEDALGRFNLTVKAETMAQQTRAKAQSALESFF